MPVKNKIKVAQVVGNAKTGGVISCVLNFYRNIDRDRFVFDFFTYGPSPFDDEIRALGGSVHYIPSVLKFFKSTREMKKLFKDNGYDIVHAHITSLSFVALRAAKKAGVQVRVCHAHSTSHPSEKVWVVKNTLKHFSKTYATHLAGCSRYACRWLYGKKRGDGAFVLKNAINLDKFTRDETQSQKLRQQYGYEGKKVVGHIGRLEFQKNPLFLIDIFAEVAKQRDDARFVMVGGGSMLEKTKQKADSLGLGDKVEIFTEKKAVEEFYRLFDIFVLPSRFEGLPLVAVEAQAMGIPCLLSEKITDETDITGHCAFLPIKSAQTWADCITAALDADGRYDGKTLVAQNGYDITKEVKNLEKFYLQIRGEDVDC